MFSVVLALALAAPSSDLGTCSWDHPGREPFMGDLPASIDRYTDIPADIRARLKDRMVRRDYDDMVDLRRDSIEGSHSYDPAIRDMHFGSGRVCHSVTRDHWTAEHLERGLVYCEGGQCILVPTVCRNVSRIDLAPAAGPLAAAPAAGPPGGEMVFPPPGAGPLAALPGPADALPGGMVGPASFEPVGSPLIGPVIGPAIPIAAFPGIPGGLIPPISPPTLPIPEPATWALWFAGLAGIGWRVGRR